ELCFPVALRRKIASFITPSASLCPQLFLSDLLIYLVSQPFEPKEVPSFVHSRLGFDLSPSDNYNPRSFRIPTAGAEMAAKARPKTSGNLLPFPGYDQMFEADAGDANQALAQNRALNPHLSVSRGAVGGIDELDVVICGTFRKDVRGLRDSFEHLK